METGRRRRVGGSALVVAVGLGLLGLVAVGRAAENYCPGSPYNCYFYETCGSIYWCDERLPVCSYPLIWPYWLYTKSYIIKECQNSQEPYDQVYCTICGEPTREGSCCAWPDDTESMCPEGESCLF